MAPAAIVPRPLARISSSIVDTDLLEVGGIVLDKSTHDPNNGFKFLAAETRVLRLRLETQDLNPHYSRIFLHETKLEGEVGGLLLFAPQRKRHAEGRRLDPGLLHGMQVVVR